MATEHSFDVVSRVDMGEVTNAVQQARKEIATRFDFRGSRAAVDLDPKARTITLTGDDEQKLRNVMEVLRERLARRSVPMRALDTGAPQKAGGGVLRQVVTLRHGIPGDKAREIQRLLRDAKIKVGSQMREDEVRVTASKKDDLQAAIALLRRTDVGLELQFVNYR